MLGGRCHGAQQIGVAKPSCRSDRLSDIAGYIEPPGFGTLQHLTGLQHWSMTFQKVSPAPRQVDQGKELVKFGERGCEARQYSSSFSDTKP